MLNQYLSKRRIRFLRVSNLLIDVYTHVNDTLVVSLEVFEESAIEILAKISVFSLK